MKQWKYKNQMYEFARKLFHCYGLMAARHSPTELASSPALWNCSNEGQGLNMPLRNTQRYSFLFMAEAHCQNTLGITCTMSLLCLYLPSVVYAEGRLFLSCSYSTTYSQQKLSNPHIFNFHTTFANLSVWIILYSAASSSQCSLVPVQYKLGKQHLKHSQKTKPILSWFANDLL